MKKQTKKLKPNLFNLFGSLCLKSDKKIFFKKTNLKSYRSADNNYLIGSEHNNLIITVAAFIIFFVGATPLS